MTAWRPDVVDTPEAEMSDHDEDPLSPHEMFQLISIDR